MDRVNQYRQIVQDFLKDFADDDPEAQLLFDGERDRYLVMHNGWRNDYRIYGCAMQLDLIEGKVWIQRERQRAEGRRQKGILSDALCLLSSAFFKLSKEEQLLECWRELSPEARERVLQLAQSLKPEPEFVPQIPLGKKLWEIRQRAIAEGMELLTEEELEQELAERRGGYREL